MSTTAKSLFLGSCIFTSVVIYKVHGYQEEERKRMREGVYKDIERRANKQNESEKQKLVNRQMLEDQAKLYDTLANTKSTPDNK